MADRGISPRTTGTVDLGSASKAWRKVYANRIDEGTYIPGAFNKKETFTTSGTFTAPVTGTYRITLQGGGGGGGACGGTGHTLNGSGGGGGQGGFGYAYEVLTAGTSYSYTVGAGGVGGPTANSGDGKAGGNTSITINGNAYVAAGGSPGRSAYNLGGPGVGGPGGAFTVNGIDAPCKGACGGNGTPELTKTDRFGGNGGGPGGGRSSSGLTNGVFGGGGAGGNTVVSSAITMVEEINGGAGGDGYVVFEWYDTTA